MINLKKIICRVASQKEIFFSRKRSKKIFCPRKKPSPPWKSNGWSLTIFYLKNVVSVKKNKHCNVFNNTLLFMYHILQILRSFTVFITISSHQFQLCDSLLMSPNHTIDVSILCVHFKGTKLTRPTDMNFSKILDPIFIWI